MRKLCKTIGVDKKPRKTSDFGGLNAANRVKLTTRYNKINFVCLKFTIMAISTDDHF